MELSPWPFPVAPPLDAPTTLAILTEGTLEPVGAIPWSSNAAIVTQVHLGDQTVTAICKPQAGEQPLADFPDGTLCKREIAAYELTRLTGQHCVPPTVLRETEWGIGAVQQFINHDPDVHFFTLRDDPENTAQLRALALFDCLSNNTDRKGGHVIAQLRSAANDKDESRQPRLYGIDHGLTFHLQWKLRTVIWEYQAEPFTTDELAILARIGEADLTATFGELLNPLEIDALRMRAQALVGRGTFPEPTGTHRDVPWPLV